MTSVQNIYKKRELNLTTSSHIGWSVSQALKELIINSIDEHEDCELLLSRISIICYKNCLLIKDEGRGIKLENFCQGNSTKKSKDLRGYHGQGLRGSISRLLLDGYNISIKSKFLEGRFIVKDSIKILYRIPEQDTTGTEIQIFFKEDNINNFKLFLNETLQNIIYFKESYGKKIEEIICKDGTCVDIYIPKKDCKIYNGGFFYKGVKIGIGKNNTDFGLIYNIKHSKDLEGKLRGNANFNRILEVKDTYKIIEHSFREPLNLNVDTIKFYETEIKDNYTCGARVTSRDIRRHKYKDLARKPLWEIFVTSGNVSGITMNFSDDNHLNVFYKDYNYKSINDKSDDKSSEQTITITKINYERNAICEKALDVLKSEGFTIKYSD
jgi:hypothetical protein